MRGRSTKIVATLGPATGTAEAVHAVIAAGADVVRVNLSHGDYAGHRRTLGFVRRAAQNLGKPVALLLDLQGPKIRLGSFSPGGVDVATGSEVTLFPNDGTLGTPLRLPVTLPDLARDLTPGARVLLDDGRVRLRVVALKGREARCLVEAGGTLTDRKGVNLPDTLLDVPPLTEKDRKDIRFAAGEGADFLCLSFVRRPEDVVMLRRELEGCGCGARVVAKIEKHEALERMDEIVAVAEAVMVARGDLGVEIPAEQVPRWQKRIIRTALRHGKEVITATQMLESMVNSPTPTRAEASDVANAVYDGTSAVMLSAETAVGRHPAGSVATMDRIVRVAEEDLAALPLFVADPLPEQEDAPSVSQAISRAAVQLAQSLRADAIITPTQTGATARQVARYRPSTHIVAVTPSEQVCRQLALTFGVVPLLVPRAEDTDGTLGQAVAAARAGGLITPGELLVLTAGVRANTAGATNLIKVEKA